MKKQNKKTTSRILIAVFVTLALLYCVATFAEAGQVKISLADADATFYGESDYDRVGHMVSGADDLNGDGVSDFLVGSMWADVGGYENSGATYLVYGGTGINGGLDFGNQNAANGIATFYGGGGYYLGRFMDGAGDINGDGYGDMLNGTSAFSGYVYLIYGGTGLSGDIYVENLNAGHGIVRFKGESSGWYNNMDLAGGGDVNGDGTPDFLIGASAADVSGNSNNGRTYLVYGGTGLTGDLNLNSQTGTHGIVYFNGINDSDYSGCSVDIVGDINGDPYSDFLIGTDGGDQAYLVYGGTGLSGEIELSNQNVGNGIVHFNAENAYEDFGSSVSACGDVNGDGVPDVLVGAPLASPGGRTSAGRTYLIFGGTGLNGTINMGNQSAGHGIVYIDGILSDDRSGYHLSNVGDMNNDGYDEIFIFAAKDTGDGTYAGESYIVFGRASWPSIINLNTNEGIWNVNIFESVGLDDRAWIGAGVGDADADGVVDLLIGVEYDSPISRTYAGSAAFMSGASVVAANPEPATMVLFGVGLAGLGWRMKRRKK